MLHSLEDGAATVTSEGGSRKANTGRLWTAGSLVRLGKTSHGDGTAPAGGMAGAVKALDPGGGGSQAQHWTAEDQIDTSCTRYHYTAQSSRGRMGAAARCHNHPDGPMPADPFGPAYCVVNGPIGGLLRPRQDDHRQVEHAGVQQAVPGGGLISRRAVLRSGVRPVRLPRRRRRPRPDGEDARSSCQLAPAGTLQKVREIVAETLHNIVDPIVYDEAV